MALPLPSSLSPSKVASFTSCGLAFKFSAIDRLPDPATPWTAKGTLVHLALERLHAAVAPAARTPGVAAALVAEAVPEVLADPACEGLDVGDLGAWVADAQQLARHAFLLEDPVAVDAVGVELKLEATLPGGLVVRGIVDRLDRRPDGTFVVVDYKTGRAPRVADEQGRLVGVHLYALLVEATFGVPVAAVELLHLREPVAITARPSARARAQARRRAGAVWAAIERACATDGFEPRPSGLCSVCAFRDRCPAWAGAEEAVESLAAAG